MIGLSKPGVLRRIDALTARLLAELPTAVDQVASMPAGPDRMLAIFSESIGTRASLVQANAKRDGDDVEPPDAELPAQDRTHGDV